MSLIHDIGKETKMGPKKEGLVWMFLPLLNLENKRLYDMDGLEILFLLN